LVNCTKKNLATLPNLTISGANPTALSYNASVVKIYSATYGAFLNKNNLFSKHTRLLALQTRSLVRIESKIFSSVLKNALS
jgi:hypothetical protein